MKLEQLTPEQERKKEEVKQFWLDYIFSCKNSINKDVAKIGIDWMYKLAGSKEPIVIYVDSPMGCQFTVAYLKELVKNQLIKPASVRASVGDSVWDSVGASVGDSVWASVRDSVGASVGDSVGASVRDSVGASVRDSVRASVGDSVWDSVRDSVGDSVGASVRDSVRASVRASVRDSVRASVRASVGDSVRDSVRASVGDSVRASVRDSVGASKLEYNSFSYYGNIGDYGWLSFFDFFTQIGVINHDKFNTFKSLILSGIYDMIQLNGFCIVSSLPTRIERDNRGRLHSNDKSAISFKDGYELWYWHGVSVPMQWIAFPETITKEIVLKETNAEKRRCLMEILGETKYAELLDLSEIETDIYNSRVVSLLKTIKRDTIIDDYIYFIKVTCPSTNRIYYLCVPYEAAQLGVIGALAWTFNMSTSEYKLLIET